MQLPAFMTLAVGLSAAMAAPSAWALPDAELNSTATGSYDFTLGAKSGNLSTSESDATGAPSTVSGSKNGFGFDATAAVNETALSAYASTAYHPAGNAGSGSSSASAVASLTDFITFSGGAGMGSASLTALLTGTLTGNNFGSAGYSLSIALYDVTDLGTSYSLSNPLMLAADTRNIAGRQFVTVNDTFESDFDFEYGKTYGLVATFSALADNGGVADFSNTTSFAMAAAPNVRLESQAGIDYGIAAVPEPQSYAMLLAGIGLMGLIARRRS
ncbi:PEP-CTERM sorting domain-containing protein [Denitromonas iodatirespirans]|uniref:PEP-CTERM sorting domain-containing protein n=1 Tax=Denitromonas iodatirespirans TaxID=2795389 RepID=A0A944DBJ7_DENI1|nr:PEP-CTERM sorting domain-containing protein [Denitromonas iodatirespirans]MBT0959688.1 PEP-CTERM sorting domain-containing protein [Denitromonas iodatirespirans]